MTNFLSLINCVNYIIKEQAKNWMSKHYYQEKKAQIIFIFKRRVGIIFLNWMNFFSSILPCLAKIVIFFSSFRLFTHIMLSKNKQTKYIKKQGIDNNKITNNSVFSLWPAETTRLIGPQVEAVVGVHLFAGAVEGRVPVYYLDVLRQL